MSDDKRPGGELERFVFEAITQIAAAVTASHAPVAALGGQVDPIGGRIPDIQGMGKIDVPGGIDGYVQAVEFDVAVTRSSGESGTGGGGLHVLAMSVGGKVESSESDTHVSRIRFSIPVVLPGQKNAQTEEERKRRQDEFNRTYSNSMKSMRSDWV